MGDITMMMKDIHKNALVLFPIELLQVAKERGKVFSSKPFLPDSFTPVITGLCNNNITCSQCHDVILIPLEMIISGLLNNLIMKGRWQGSCKNYIT